LIASSSRPDHHPVLVNKIETDPKILNVNTDNVIYHSFPLAFIMGNRRTYPMPNIIRFWIISYWFCILYDKSNQQEFNRDKENIFL
jgi:hypothetical protein